MTSPEPRPVTGAIGASVIAVALLAAAASGARGAGATTAGRPRVLLISLPATSWADVEAADAPNLQALLAESAVADLVTRAAGRRNSIGGGYTTLGAGGRASAVTPLARPGVRDRREPYGDTTAGEVYRQRTGLTADRRARAPRPRRLVQENADGLYDPTIGALGDALVGPMWRERSSPTATARSPWSTTSPSSSAPR